MKLFIKADIVEKETITKKFFGLYKKKNKEKVLLGISLGTEDGKNFFYFKTNHVKELAKNSYNKETKKLKNVLYLKNECISSNDTINEFMRFLYKIDENYFFCMSSIKYIIRNIVSLLITQYYTSRNTDNLEFCYYNINEYNFLCDIGILNLYRNSSSSIKNYNFYKKKVVNSKEYIKSIVSLYRKHKNFRYSLLKKQFVKVAYDSWNSLMEYIESKGIYENNRDNDEDKDVKFIINKSYMDRWLTNRDLDIVKDIDKTEYLNKHEVEAEKYIEAIKETQLNDNELYNMNNEKT